MLITYLAYFQLSETSATTPQKANLMTSHSVKPSIFLKANMGQLRGPKRRCMEDTIGGFHGYRPGVTHM